MWRVGQGREPWERSEAGEPGLDLSRLALSSLLLLSFRSSSVGLETGEWRRCRSLSLNSTGLAPLPRLSAPPHSSQVSFNKTNQNKAKHQTKEKPKQNKPNQNKAKQSKTPNQRKTKPKQTKPKQSKTPNQRKTKPKQTKPKQSKTPNQRKTKPKQTKPKQSKKPNQKRTKPNQSTYNRHVKSSKNEGW